MAVVALALGALLGGAVVLMVLDVRARWRSEIRPRWTDDDRPDDTSGAAETGSRNERAKG